MSSYKAQRSFLVLEDSLIKAQNYLVVPDNSVKAFLLYKDRYQQGPDFPLDEQNF